MAQAQDHDHERERARDREEELDLDQPAQAKQDAGENRRCQRPPVVVCGAQEGQDCERQQAEDEIARIGRDERLPDHEHRVDPQPVGGEVEPARERRQDGGHERHVPASGQAPRQEVRPERDDRKPDQPEQRGGGRRVDPEQAREGREQEVEARWVVGGQSEVRPVCRERAHQDRVREAPVVEEVVAGVERGEHPDAVDGHAEDKEDAEPSFDAGDRGEALSYTSDRFRESAAGRQVAGHAP